MNALLHSLDIDSELRSWEPQGPFPELEKYWSDAHAGKLAAVESGQHLQNSDQWAENFNTSRDPQQCVGKFQQQRNGWADQFDKVFFLGIFLCLIHIST